MVILIPYLNYLITSGSTVSEMRSLESILLLFISLNCNGTRIFINELNTDSPKKLEVTDFIELASDNPNTILDGFMIVGISIDSKHRKFIDPIIDMTIDLAGQRTNEKGYLSIGGRDSKAEIVLPQSFATWRYYLETETAANLLKKATNTHKLSLC